MKYWAIEPRPGELLADEAIVDEAVSRIVGITTVEALFLFTTRIALDAFMEDFLAEDGEGLASRQELEAAFERELRAAGTTTIEGSSLRFPVFNPKDLSAALESVAMDVRYVVLDPDTSRQQVWSVERFKAHLREDPLGKILSP